MSHSMDMKSAWAQMKSSAVSNWTDVRPRLFDACQPEVPTSFTVPADSTVFTIGSCFARNIEENLARLGYRLPMLDFDVPDQEKRNSRAAGLLNKYTPPAVWQELDWCARILRRDGVVTDADCADLYYEMDGLCHDAVMHDRFPLTKERMEKAVDSEWFAFWKNLKTGYDHFERTKTPPNTEVRNKRYHFD